MSRATSELSKNPKAPNFFIVGAMKAATTSLAAALADHPGIYMSPAKEPHFFADWPGCDDRLSELLMPYSSSPTSVREHGALRFPDAGSYLGLFADADQQPCRGEASTSYLASRCAPIALKTTFPDAKIIVVLRNMYERTNSGFQFLRSRGREPASTLEEAIEHELEGKRSKWAHAWRHVQLSLYTDQLAKYFDAFGRANVHVIWFEALRSEPGATLREAHSFLGLPHIASELRAENPTRVHQNGPALRLKSALLYLPARRSLRRITPSPVYKYMRSAAAYALRRVDAVGHPPPPITSDNVALLAPIFEPEVDRLEALTGRDLSHWRRDSFPRRSTATSLHRGHG